jgi:hypothetical protein
VKQGMTRKLKPKDKHETKSWQRRNEARKPKQDAHAQEAANLAIENEFNKMAAEETSKEAA